MKLLLVSAVALVAILSASVFFTSMKKTPQTIPASVVARYSEWKRLFGKLYSTPAESTFRLQVFYQQLTLVDEQNESYNAFAAETGQVLTGPMFELNTFSDLSEEEFTAMYTGDLPTSDEETSGPSLSEILPVAPEKNLAQQGYNIIVRHQGSCGSCWAFSATANFEKFYWNKKQQRLSFSQQQLVDCDRSSNGCNGGLAANGLRYFSSSGASLASNYPYKAANGACNSKTSHTLGFKVASEGFSASKHAGVVRGGIHLSVSVYASGAFRSLSKTDDIYNAASSNECGNTKNHAINAVDADGSGNYFKLLNSWGTGWAVGGFKKVKPCSSTNLMGNGIQVAYPY